MTLKEFARMLDGREYGNEITAEEERLAKELGFVVVFGYSDDNVELRGAIDDEFGCYGGGVLGHNDLPDTILVIWEPEDEDCAWAYATRIPHEIFHIYEDGQLFCIGIVCDINSQTEGKVPTNDDRLRAMSYEELVGFMQELTCPPKHRVPCGKTTCAQCWADWLQQPAEEVQGDE